MEEKRIIIVRIIVIIANVILIPQFIDAFFYEQCRSKRNITGQNNTNPNINNCLTKGYPKEKDHWMKRHQGDLLMDSLKTISILCKDTAIQNHSQTLVYNNSLLSTLQQRETSLRTWILAKEDDINQVRNFYFAILAAIFGIFSIKKQKKKMAIYIGLLSVIACLYTLDVHQEDMSNLKHIRCLAYNKALDEITNTSVNEIIYYRLYDEKLEEKIEEARQSRIRHSRKYFLVFKPNFERTVYYIIPWLAISLILIFFHNPKKNKLRKPITEIRQNRLHTNMTRFFLK